MHALRWLILAPFRLLGAILLAVGYLLAFLTGVALLGGGTALTMTGAGAVLGVPAMVIGFLVLRELFDDSSSQAPAPQLVPEPPAPAPVYPYAGYTPHAQAPAPAPAYAHASFAPDHGAAAPQPARSPGRHFCLRQPAYYWVPGRWTVR